MKGELHEDEHTEATTNRPVALKVANDLLLAEGVFLGWKSFRRDFSGLGETLKELREDRAWLGEMASEMIRSTGVNSPAYEE